MTQAEYILAIGGLVAECRQSGASEGDIAAPLLNAALALAINEGLTKEEILYATGVVYDQVVEKLKDKRRALAN